MNQLLKNFIIDLHYQLRMGQQFYLTQVSY